MNPHKLTMFGVQRAHLNWTEIHVPVCSRKYAQSEKCLTAGQGVAGLIPGTRQNWRDSDDHVKWWTPLQLKPGFHNYDRPDRPDCPSRFKIFRDDPDDWGDR